MRIAILGNSGSGKSTLARWLSARGDATLLDLDTVAWEPNQVAVPRSPEAAKAEVSRFCLEHTRWVIEGCYAGLITTALPFATRLIFLNPGESACVENCRARPWEPHKYASKQEQDSRLDFLLSWVREYYSRDGDMSLVEHARCFANYGGPKIELTSRPALSPPAPELLECLG